MNKKIILWGLATATLLSGAAAYAADPVKTKDSEQQAQTASKKTAATAAPRAKVRSVPVAKARPAQPKKIKAQTRTIPEIISPLEATDENRSGAEMGGGMKGGMGGIRR